MKLNTLTLKNYRIFSDLTVSFHKRFTILAGDNGAGKTSVLDGAAVAIGTLFTKLEGVPAAKLKPSDALLKACELGGSDNEQTQYPISISAIGSCSGKEIQWTRRFNAASKSTTIREAREFVAISQEIRQRLQNDDQTLLLPIIAYYSADGLQGCHRTKYPNTSRTNGYIDCLNGTVNTKLMMNWLRKMTVQQQQRLEMDIDPIPELETVYRALESCFTSITGYSEVAVRYNLNTNDLDIRYINAHGLLTCIPLSRLSGGHRRIISLVADIAYRMANLNPQLLDRVIEETEGIVLIDEIESHLHPLLQQRILGVLTQIFPKVQFIVSTHAPKVINSVRSENLVLLKDDQICKPASQIYGKDVKSVLEEIMGTGDRPDDIVELFNLFYRHLSEKSFIEAEQILDELDELREYHDPEISSCRVKLRLEKLRG